VCTVVCAWDPAAAVPVRMMALRDELTSRVFDEPDAWWSEQPDVIGGRDRRAGGTWCASAVSSGVTAVVLNRPERRVADPDAPSRGVLPLLGTEHWHTWGEYVDIAGMASFNLVLATPDRLTWWSYDGAELKDHELAPGTHHITPTGLVEQSVWARRPLEGVPTLDGQLDALWGAWRAEVTGVPPSADPGAMIVSRTVEADGATDIYQTVFGQFIAARPGRLRIDHARLPYRQNPWTTRTWSVTDGRLAP